MIKGVLSEMLSIPKCLRILFLLDRFLLSYYMTALKLRTICPRLYFNNEHLIQHKLSKDSLIFQKDVFLLLNNSVNLMGYEIKIYLIIKKKLQCISVVFIASAPSP